MTRSNQPVPPHPCERCGQPTIFRRCDRCLYGEVTRGAALASTQPAATQPTTPALKHARTLDDVSWQADIGAIGGALDGDEFARTLDAVRRALEVKPPTRFWSGMCLWCAREIREQSGEAETHLPPLHRIRSCYRHRKAQIGLVRWLRGEHLYRQFTEQYGFGHGPSGKGGAA